MGLLEDYAVRYDTATLRNRVEAAIAKASTDILNEAAGTANHANRLLWATAALLNTKSVTEQFMWPVAANATIAADPENATDNDVQYVVNSWIDSFATG